MRDPAGDGQGRARCGVAPAPRGSGAEVMGSTQEELAAVLREQVARVRPLVEELKLVVQ